MSSSRAHSNLFDGGRGAEWTVGNLLLAALFALAAFAVFELHSYFGKPLSETPELRVAVVAREMLQSGDYILPTFGGEARLKKPPMPYWLAALSAKVFFNGSQTDPRSMARAAQFPPAFSAALAVFVVAFFGCSFFSRPAGLIAAAVLASCELCMRFAQIGYCDSTLMLCCALSACCVSRLLSEKAALLPALFGGVALGAGILTKGHIPVVLLVIPSLVEAVARRAQLRVKSILYCALMLALALAIAAPWYAMVERQHPGAMKELLSEAGDSIQKPTANSTDDGQSHPQSGHRQNDRWTYYLYKGAFGLLPWSLLLLVECLAGVPLLFIRRLRSAPLGIHARFLALYALAGFLIFYFAAKKQDYYLLPLLPAVALVLGAIHARMNTPGGFVEERMGWAQHALGGLLALALLCAPWWPVLIDWLKTAGIGKAGYLASHVSELSAALGPFAIPLALAVLIVSFFCARQWINGRGHVVIFLFAALALSATVFAAVNPGERSRNAAFWSSLDKVGETFKAESKDSALVAPGLDDALVLFYAGRNPHPIRELAGDSIRGPVMFLIQGDSLKNAARAFKFDLKDLPLEVSNGFSTLLLAENSPQLAEIRQALKAWQSARSSATH